MNQTQSTEAAQEATALRHVQLAADWYYFIVGVTIVVLLVVGITGRALPAFGLFTPVMLMGGVPQNLAASLLLLVLMAAILLVFIAIGIKAAEGSQDACRLGFALYLVDSVLMMLTFNSSTGPFQRYGGLLFHFFGLVGLGNGIVAVAHLERLRSVRLMRGAAPRRHPLDPSPAAADPLPALERATLPEAGRVVNPLPTPGGATLPEAGRVVNPLPTPERATLPEAGRVVNPLPAPGGATLPEAGRVVNPLPAPESATLPEAGRVVHVTRTADAGSESGEVGESIDSPSASEGAGGRIGDAWEGSGGDGGRI